MKIETGQKYVLTVKEVITDSTGKQYAKIKGFNTLMFDSQGLAKLKELRTVPEPEDTKAAIEKGWQLAQRIANTSKLDLKKIGFKINDTAEPLVDDFYDVDEFEASCDIISKYTAAEAEQIFKEFDSTREECKDDRDDIDIDFAIRYLEEMLEFFKRNSHGQNN